MTPLELEAGSLAAGTLVESLSIVERWSVGIY